MRIIKNTYTVLGGLATIAILHTYYIFLSDKYSGKTDNSKIIKLPESVNQTIQNKIDWKPEAGKYQTGNYKVEIYQNGFKIGEGVKSLKKGGLFG